MPFKLAEAFVDITARDSQFNSTLASARSRLSAFSSAMSSLALPVAGIAGVAAIGKGLMDSMKSAGDLNESISKTDVVFGDASSSVVAFARQMREQFGSAEASILDAAAGIGLIGKAAGQSQGDAAAMAVQLARLADDASSFYNVPLEEALLTIRSALVGESEPIRKFGVLLNEAAVQSEAMSLGLAKSKDQMTEAAKVAARYSLIVKGMRDASGDHERTQDSFNNQLREFEGRLASLGTALGKTLVPAANALLAALNPVVEKLGQVADAVGEIPRLAGQVTTDAMGVVALPDRLTRSTGFERARGAAAGPDPAAEAQAKAAKDLQDAAKGLVDKEQERATLASAVDAERLRRQEESERKRSDEMLVMFARNIGEADTFLDFQGKVNPLVRGILEETKQAYDDNARETIKAIQGLGGALLQMGANRVGGLIDMGGAAAQQVARQRAEGAGRARGALGVTDADSFLREAQDAAANRRGNQEDQLKKLTDIATTLGSIQAAINNAKLKLIAPFGGN